MKRNKNCTKIFSYTFIIVFLFFFQTIAYSAFSSTMNITGIAHSRLETNIRITDFRLAISNNATSAFEEFGENHIITNVDFKSSSSSITYYLEITNYGSVDVGIFDITGLPNGVNYSIKDYNLKDKICDDSDKCNNFIKKTYELTLFSDSVYSGNIQMNFDFRTYHKVTYTGINIDNSYALEIIDGGNLSITFTENLNKVIVLSGGVEIKYYDQILSGQTIIIENVCNDIELKSESSVVKIISGDLDTVGSEVCIKDECFYIILSDESSVTMLAKMNITTDAIPIQSSSASTLAFSSSCYWYSGGLKVEYGTEYPVYVYDSNSLIYNYVENYKTYLESLGVAVKEARLIKDNELETLGCSITAKSCSGAPSWVYSTKYWSGIANSSTTVLYVNSNSNCGFYSYSGKNYYGTRPVITILKDYLQI